MPSETNRGARTYKRYDRFNPGREAWVDLPRYVAVMYRNPENVEQDEAAVGHDFIRLSFHFGGRSGTNLNLTTLTALELKALKEVVDRAFEAALPICESLDAEAQEAFDQGDDTRVRLYRPVPQVIVRERVQPEHRPSVRGGRDFLPGVGGADVLAEQRRAGGSPVRDDDAGVLEAEDDSPEG